jgi:arylsulfatase A-like enzyme
MVLSFRLVVLAATWVPAGFLARSTLADTVTVPAGRPRPNVVLFVADDMGFADCGFNGCPDIPTPSIDSLSAGGVRFLNGYTSGCVCSPTRAALMTGRYQQRFGFDANAEGKAQPADRGPRGLDIRQTTFAQRFKAAGYSTAMFGKWHLGADPGYWPTERGFDEFYGLLPYGIAAGGPNGVPIYRGTTRVDAPANHMEQFCAEALSFIDRNRDKPFFLYLPFTAVHAPFVGPQPFLSRFDTRVPANRGRYAADLAQMDDIIGRIMTRLRRHNLETNTLIFFFSDNGGPGGASSNAPFQGTKWTLWEGGIHVPFAASWKGRIPAGRILDQPVIQVDILPTALAAAGIATDPAWALDGVNLLPYLEGKQNSLPREALFWRFGIQYAVRKGDWKLVKPHINLAPRLFRLTNDPGERNDLATQEPAKVKELQALWDAWNVRNETPRWQDDRWNGDGTKLRKAAMASKAAARAAKSRPAP